MSYAPILPIVWLHLKKKKKKTNNNIWGHWTAFHVLYWNMGRANAEGLAHETSIGVRIGVHV